METSGPIYSTIVDSSYKPLRAIFKLILLLAFPIILVFAGVIFVQKYYAKNLLSKSASQDVLVIIPMQETNWQDLGNVFEPIVPVKVKTNDGFQENKFLLDSGAVISSLPRDWAEKTGQNLAFLQRTTFRGFGNTQSFAYQGNMVILLGDDEMTLPVVFTETAGTKSLLGRKGFFENHSIFFDHKKRQIEIRK